MKSKGKRDRTKERDYSQPPVSARNKSMPCTANKFKERMIPSRLSIQRSKAKEQARDTKRKSQYERYLSGQLFGRQRSIFTEAKNKTIQEMMAREAKEEPKRKLQPYKVLSTGMWTDNFYTNLLDWSYLNVIGMAFQKTLEIFNPTRELGMKNSIRAYFNSSVQSISFSKDCAQISTGLNSGQLYIYDFVRNKKIREISLSRKRLSTIEWKGLLLCGSQDKCMYLVDPRSKFNFDLKMQFHQEQICGVRQFGNFVATGASDGTVVIMDVRRPQFNYDFYGHEACVRALCWAADGKHLYSGGGCEDRRILKWNMAQREIVSGVSTSSQVCNLLYNGRNDELVACLGFSTNEISLWTKDLKRSAILNNKRESRVLYCCLSPDEQRLLTGSGNGDLEFWKPFTTLALENPEDIR